MGEQYLVKKTDSPVRWEVEVPGSKSMTNRALLMAALTEGTVELEGVLFSDDSRYFLSSLQSLGFALTIKEKEKKVTVTGCNGVIPKKEGEIYVGSAGTAARFLTAMLGLSDGSYTIQASDQMKKRPMKPLFDLLESVGAKITYLGQEGFLPVRITGCRKASAVEEEGVGNESVCDRDKRARSGDEGERGIDRRECVGDKRERDRDKRVCVGDKRGCSGDRQETETGGDSESCPPEQERELYLELDISKSTQFLSALLLVSPMVKQGLEIRITSEKTDGSYIRITRKMLEEAGVTAEFDGRTYRVPAGASYHKTRYRIEPDVSAACYFYGAAAITGGTALVKNVHSDNSQGDMKFLEVLRDMGCTVEEEPEGIRVTGPKIGELKGIGLNMNDFSDQALTLAAMAPYANSKVRITGIGHIRGQESDRLHAMATELGKAGICCAEEQSAITIFPGQPKAAVIETYEDHRVAMAFSLLGLRTEGIVIDNPGCCKKTFEEYFDLLDRLTGKN